MATIKALLDRLESLNTDQIVQDTMEEAAPDIAVKNREQLFSGEQSDGADITPAYKPLTIAIKQEKGQPTDRVTLRDTGAFYQGLYVRVNSDTITTDSTDEKAAKLKEKYGEQIFGLNDKFASEVMAESIRPTWKAKIEEATGLKLT